MDWTYRAAGVNVEAASALKKRIKSFAESTFGPAVLSEIGSFGGLFALPSGLDAPVLVASTDGVGTKLKVAALVGKHDTVGMDLVNHCVNDILVQGARPLFFLDYLATGRLYPDIVASVVKGLAEACRAAGCALLGGETAEMPGMYADGEYDLAGTIVGLVNKEEILPRADIHPGDLVLGLPSDGLHTNGYSLVRRLCLDGLHLTLDDYLPELGSTLGRELMRPHRSYANAILPLLPTGMIKGLVHLTGGGYQGNIPRILPPGIAVGIDPSGWPAQPIFTFLAKRGGIARDEMFRTFNMGLGMLIITAPSGADRLVAALAAAGETAYHAGVVVEGEGVEII